MKCGIFVLEICGLNEEMFLFNKSDDAFILLFYIWVGFGFYVNWCNCLNFVILRKYCIVLCDIIQLLHLSEINMRFYGAEYNNIEWGEAEFNIVVLCSIKPHIDQVQV